MSLVDVPERVETIEQTADGIRQGLRSAISVADATLSRIRQVVQEKGRATIAAELGNDAAALLLVYTKLKEAVEAAKGITVEDLP